MGNIFRELRHFSQNTPGFRWMYLLARKSGLTKVVMEVRRGLDRKRNDKCLEFDRYYQQHIENFNEIAELLTDELSRRTLAGVLEFRRTGNRNALKRVIAPEQYFPTDIFAPIKDEVFVDGGAYVGDTIESFIKNFAGGGYKHIYAWEPDKVNLKELEKCAGRYERVTVVPCGMWSEKKELTFFADASMASKIVEDEEQSIQRIPVDSIDNVCSGEKVTFIKMDIEGSELAALKGSVNVIKRDKPRLAICVYHKPEDLYTIPLWIKQAVPEYKLYLRQHEISEYETVLYAVP